jgi:hypothetical protein
VHEHKCSGSGSVRPINHGKFDPDPLFFMLDLDCCYFRLEKPIRKLKPFFLLYMFIQLKQFYTVFTVAAPGSHFSGMPALLFIPSPGTEWRGGNVIPPAANY